MKSTSVIALLFTATIVAQPVRAEINIRISVKFILDANGNLPVNSSSTAFGGSTTNLINSQAVVNNINFSNQLLAQMGRGYRIDLTEIRQVSGASRFYNINARSSENRIDLETAATAGPAARDRYFWRDDAINIYINNTSSGVCSFPGHYSAIFVGSVSYNTLILHEVGHFFDLLHTHQSGGDEVSDTVVDNQNWTFAQLTANNPGATTSQLSDVWLNIMSYHLPQNLLTAGQLDRWTDTANGARTDVTSGRTWFVDDDAVGAFPTGSSEATAGIGGPFRRVQAGIDAASAEDIVLVRAGNYYEQPTVSDAVTLRATRGSAIIGR
jgi:hypothetical protein